jgi:hypothetical protein
MMGVTEQECDAEPAGNATLSLMASEITFILIPGRVANYRPHRGVNLFNRCTSLLPTRKPIFGQGWRMSTSRL